ncbi:H-NS histone family protein [Luteimonas fraxinea]|uniref:H-NS histone family protein n=1 Tax=Luteimonas fraxinea TaxID=2901869 RepID=A0ABS8UFB7_9GAMM|nr:H-NS histone family protein [Luteimonas fraxinea]MCD9098190.1 H-NS histone family protein [Luteimonas fraxinea]MCD9126916.1 H-NS histone family protein [Luteimonas fraxinea]UHH08868.1 H-NS histone family protein [Luteimonas fraxinea]
MKFALDMFSASDLDSLIDAAEQQKRRASRRPIKRVREELIAAAASLGYSIDDVFGDSTHQEAPEVPATKRRKTTKAAIKYRDPENRKNVWSGRGSLPRWLRAKVSRGQAPADFLIPGLAKPTASTKNAIGKKTVYKQG